MFFGRIFLQRGKENDLGRFTWLWPGLLRLSGCFFLTRIARGPVMYAPGSQIAGMEAAESCMDVSG